MHIEPALLLSILHCICRLQVWLLQHGGAACCLYYNDVYGKNVSVYHALCRRLVKFCLTLTKILVIVHHVSGGVFGFHVKLFLCLLIYDDIASHYHYGILGNCFEEAVHLICR